MKNIILVFTLLFTSASILHAQEKNDKLKNTKEVTITKTVTVKGINEETTETKVVEKENQIIKINETGVENQDEVYSTEKKIEQEKVSTKTTINAENEAALLELKKKQEAEIEASKKAHYAKYEEERIEKEKKRAEELNKEKKVREDD